MTSAVASNKDIVEFIPPEGVPIHLRLASISSRFGAQFLDFLLLFLLGLLVFLFAFYAIALSLEAATFLIVLVSFLFRTPYYILSELIWNGRTLGKKLVGIRVINADGRRLTPHQIATRNLLKEVEIITPTFLLLTIETMSAIEIILTIVWVTVVVVVPNRSRLRQRLGDMAAGTIVVENPKSVLLHDIAVSQSRTKNSQLNFIFEPEHLDFYGKFELQVLEEILRQVDSPHVRQEIVKVKDAVVRKIGFTDPVSAGQEKLFLNEFYRAQRQHLEKLKLFGESRDDKFHSRTSGERD